MWRFQFAHIYIYISLPVTRTCVHFTRIFNRGSGRAIISNSVPIPLYISISTTRQSLRFFSASYLIDFQTFSRIDGSTSVAHLSVSPSIACRVFSLTDSCVAVGAQKRIGYERSSDRDSIQSLPNQQLPPKTSFSNHTLPLELKLKTCGTRQHRGIT